MSVPGELLSEALDICAEIEREPASRKKVLHRLQRRNPALHDAVLELLECSGGTSVPAHTIAGHIQEAARELFPQTEDRLIGKQLGIYHIKSRIGAGGMGTVYLADDLSLHRPTAVKVVSDPASAMLRQSFEREIANLSTVPHPNIATIFQAGSTVDGQLYFGMEFVKGEHITTYCERNKLPLRKRLELFVQVCLAVQAAHSRTVVHRDIKPNNILVDNDGQVKLLDFGVAGRLDPLLQNAAVFVSLAFAPPEYESSETDVRFDVYSLGVLLFNLVTGTLPFPERASREDVRSRTATGNLFRPSEKRDRRIPFGDLGGVGPSQWRELDQIFRRACALDAAKRYSSVEALARDVEAFLQSRTVEAMPQTWQYRTRKYTVRNWKPLLTSAMVFVALATALLMTLVFYRRAVRQQKITSEINQFLTDDVLLQSNPDIGGGPGETLPQAIQNAAPQIDRRFHDAPVVAASIHDTLAGALDNLDDYDGANDQFEAGAKSWKEAEGPLSQNAIVDQLQAAFLQGRSQNPGPRAQAGNLLRAQEALLQTIRKPRPDVDFFRLQAEAGVAMGALDMKTALQRVSDADALAVRSPEISENLKVTARQRLCTLQLRVGQAREAETCMRDLKKRVAAEHDQMRTPTEFELQIAQALLLQGKLKETVQEVNTNYPDFVRQFGAESELTQDLMGVKVQAENELEDWDHAIPDALAVVAIAKKTQPSGFMAVAGLSDTALTECRIGRFDDGVGHAREALQAASVPDEAPGLADLGRYTLADCLILKDWKSGEATAGLSEAAMLLKSVDARAVAVLAADPGWPANLTLAQGELQFLRGDYVAARQSLDHAKPVLTAPGGDKFQRKSTQELDDRLGQRGD